MGKLYHQRGDTNKNVTDFGVPRQTKFYRIRSRDQAIYL